MSDSIQLQRRKRRSKLDTPEIVRATRAFTMRKIAHGGREHSYQCLANMIKTDFGIVAHKTTVRSFVRRLGLNFAWGTA